MKNLETLEEIELKISKVKTKIDFSNMVVFKEKL